MNLDGLRKLIDQTFSYMVEATAEGDADMARCYFEDMMDFKNIYYLFNRGYTMAAWKSVDELDTLPREQIYGALEAVS